MQDDKKVKNFNFRNFDQEVWYVLKKEALERRIAFQDLVQVILREWIDKNTKKE